MALSVSSSTSAPDALNWVDFYVKNRNDGGPIQALFSQNLLIMSQITVGHLNDTGALTETIVGATHGGNVVIVPGRTGTIQLTHHGFGAATEDGFALIFAQGNLDDCTIFKSIPRAEAVVQLGNERGRRSGTNLDCPSLESLMGARTRKLSWPSLPRKTESSARGQTTS